jgi:hypothetical protein
LPQLVLASILLATAACARVAGPPADVAAASATAAASDVPPTATEPPTETPPHSATPEPTPAVLLAAGDIASCRSEGDEATAALVEGLEGTVATLGDSVYDRGSPQEFADCFEPSWGRLKDRIRPAVGNHEYLTPGAAGYYAYFGPAAGDPSQGYYSYDLGAWHIVVLNSQCWEVGGCGRNQPQAVWLEADLRAHPARCTLAYWHMPRYSSGPHGDSDLVDAYWDLLVGAGAEVVLTGHDHNYQRFAPRDAEGEIDRERGLRQFVVGTGGFTLYRFPGPAPAASEARDDLTHGVLRLRLFEDRYEWEFLPVGGTGFTDSGADVCHD